MDIYKDPIKRLKEKTLESDNEISKEQFWVI
jgi:hypothetical protein